jgi:hypothetical protein
MAVAIGFAGNGHANHATLVTSTLSSIRGNRPHCATTNTIRKYSANGNSEV